MSLFLETICVYNIREQKVSRSFSIQKKLKECGFMDICVEYTIIDVLPIK